MSAAPFRREDIDRMLGHVRGWATTELVTGLLAHPDLLAALEDGASLDTLAGLTGLPDRQIASLLHALELEDVVAADAGEYQLTAFGRALVPMRGFVELFTRGYAGYFHNAAALWAGTVDPNWRNMDELGRASVAISEWGALPMTVQALRTHRPNARLVVDVGCANARSLVRLCELMPDIQGVALEPDTELCREAEVLVHEAGLDRRVTVVNQPVELWEPEARADAFVFGFVLQELVDDQTVVDLLQRLVADSPEALFIAIEVDAAGWDVDHASNDAHALGYYNPYYLLHGLTEQRLRTVGEWKDLFGVAGLEVVDMLTVDSSVDPTGNEVAFVLSGRP